MEKQIFIILSIMMSLLSNKVYLQTQNAVFEIQYRVSHQNLNNTSLGNEALDNEFKNELSKVMSVLQCNRYKSKFFTKYSSGNNDYISTIIRASNRVNQTEYVNIRDKIRIIEIFDNGTKQYLLRTDSLIWEITDEIQIINDMECIFAKGQSVTPGYSPEKVNVWFTKKYPLPFGPFGWHGLPGLIVQLQTGNMTYTAGIIKPVDAKNVILDPEADISNALRSDEYFMKMQKKKILRKKN